MASTTVSSRRVVVVVPLLFFLLFLSALGCHGFSMQTPRSPTTSSSPAFWAAPGPAFCGVCGTPTASKIPEGDERERRVCTNTECGHVHYENPKVVVGVVCTHQRKVLLCQRAIEPCSGKWGYPQGFLELGETTRQGAAREAFEEAGVVFDPSDAELLAVYNLAGMQVQTIYRVELPTDEFEAGPESSDVVFVDWEDVPWDDLAFATVEWALEHARAHQDDDRPEVQERTKWVTEDGKWMVDKS